jgi:hypothetical protein
MPTATVPDRLTDDEGRTLRVLDSGCDGEVVHTDDGTSWEAVEDRPGEWTEPDSGRTARSAR